MAAMAVRDAAVSQTPSTYLYRTRSAVAQVRCHTAAVWRRRSCRHDRPRSLPAELVTFDDFRLYMKDRLHMLYIIVEAEKVALLNRQHSFRLRQHGPLLPAPIACWKQALSAVFGQQRRAGRHRARVGAKEQRPRTLLLRMRHRCGRVEHKGAHLSCGRLYRFSRIDRSYELGIYAEKCSWPPPEKPRPHAHPLCMKAILRSSLGLYRFISKERLLCSPPVMPRNLFTEV